MLHLKHHSFYAKTKKTLCLRCVYSNNELIYTFYFEDQ